MNILKFTVVLAFVLLLSQVEAKKKRKYNYQPSNKTKTKTKWSTSTDLGMNGASAVVATEEHGYYVKRTYLPTLNGSSTTVTSGSRQSPPYLAIPIAWFNCEGDACNKGNTVAINNAASESGFLCDDDCVEPYEPLCGKTASEVAVFYNKCKLYVAKCRTHGLWMDLPYDECKQLYKVEVAYADKKFRSSPYFREVKAAEQQPTEIVVKVAQEESIVNIAMEALSEINDKLTEEEKTTATEKQLEHTTVRNALPAKENEVVKQPK